jgi:hypothetical protein
MGQLEQLVQNKNLFYLHDEPNEPTKEGPLSFVLFKTPFNSVSIVRMSHHSLVSLSVTPPPPPSFFLVAVSCLYEGLRPSPYT